MGRGRQAGVPEIPMVALSPARPSGRDRRGSRVELLHKTGYSHPRVRKAQALHLRVELHVDRGVLVSELQRSTLLGSVYGSPRNVRVVNRPVIGSTSGCLARERRTTARR